MNELNTNQLVYIGIVFVLSVVIFLAVANLLPLAPHESKNAPIDAAIPIHIVLTSGLTYGC